MSDENRRILEQKALDDPEALAALNRAARRDGSLSEGRTWVLAQQAEIFQLNYQDPYDGYFCLAVAETLMDLQVQAFRPLAGFYHVDPEHLLSIGPLNNRAFQIVKRNLYKLGDVVLIPSDSEKHYSLFGISPRLRSESAWFGQALPQEEVNEFFQTLPENPRIPKLLKDWIAEKEEIHRRQAENQLRIRQQIQESEERIRVEALAKKAAKEAKISALARRKELKRQYKERTQNK